MREQYRASAIREAVWNVLNDLQACLQGRETSAQHSVIDIQTVIKTTVGPIRATVACPLAVSDMEPPVSCLLSGEVHGGAVGIAGESVKVKTRESDCGADLRYAVAESLRGKIAQIGARVIDSVPKIMSGFFETTMRTVNERIGIATDSPPHLQSLRTGPVLALVVAAFAGLVVRAVCTSLT